MNLGEALIGLGLLAYVVFFYAVARRSVGSDGRIAEVAKVPRSARWLDYRSRRMTPDEYVALITREQRRIFKWAVTPFTILLVVICIEEIVHGLFFG